MFVLPSTYAPSNIEQESNNKAALLPGKDQAFCPNDYGKVFSHVSLGEG